MNLLISVPAWRPHYVDYAARYTVPAVLEAYRWSPWPGDVKFLIHTDRPDVFRRLLQGHDNEIRPAPRQPNFIGLTQAHDEAVAAIPEGGAGLLLNSDIVVSREVFAKGAEIIERGFSVIASIGVRSLIETELPPIGADARTLLDWSWRNKHPIIKDLIWGTGRSRIPTMLFFENGGSVVCHCFHMHPFFVVKNRNLRFRGTIDNDLMAKFADRDIYVVCNREIGFAELSPITKRFGSAQPLSIDFMNSFGKRFTPAHVRNFRHAMRICGDDAVETAAGTILAAVAQDHHRMVPV
jgi:hypothetical protein